MRGHDTDTRFRLAAWRDPAGADPVEEVSDDGAALQARARALTGAGYWRADLQTWSLELNDWVRIERFHAD